MLKAYRRGGKYQSEMPILSTKQLSGKLVLTSRGVIPDGPAPLSRLRKHSLSYKNNSTLWMKSSRCSARIAVKSVAILLYVRCSRFEMRWFELYSSSPSFATGGRIQCATVL